MIAWQFYYLFCKCTNKHEWKLALPFYEFKINDPFAKCPECKKPIHTVQFMGGPSAQPKEHAHE